MISEYKVSGRNILYIFLYFILSLFSSLLICFLVKRIFKLSEPALLLISLVSITLNSILTLRVIRPRMEKMEKTKEEIREYKINKIIKK